MAAKTIGAFQFADYFIRQTENLTLVAFFFFAKVSLPDTTPHDGFESISTIDKTGRQPCL